MKSLFCIALVMLFSMCALRARAGQVSHRRVLVLYENGGHHLAYSLAAKNWLNKLATDSGLTIDYITDAQQIGPGSLDHYQLIIQLDYPPYSWPLRAEKAFQQYIEKGKGGWLGFHHATLLGQFDGYPLWSWFAHFMGDIRFKNYISTFANGMVKVEDGKHPVMEGVPATFLIEKEEWYTYNLSPRGKVKVLASVDESTYEPSATIKMGDHPVVWVNPQVKARNVYIFMGHSPQLFKNEAYKRLVSNAIFWALRT
ncbi:ThuA domain-containing protein [Mucilaginibacter sp. PAMB04168]|uniref:ThuA domain-containing protein n=1 Tax=Mucilaginibacter sp. PAMB04168 TaxID=3138567 RepID=UPI0031F6CE62